MTNLHIQSVCSPFDDPKLASAAIRALTYADAMGLLSRPVISLDNFAIREIEAGMAEAGIGCRFISEFHRLFRSGASRLSTYLEQIGEVLDRSPLPQTNGAHCGASWEWNY